MARSKWQSAIFHESLRDGRSRDVFPLPHLAIQKLQNQSMCRSVSRRVLCRGHITERVNLAVDSLNSLFFGGMTHCPKRDAVGDLGELNLNQRLAMTDLIAAVKRLGAPPARDSGALKALRVAASSYFSPEVGVGDVVAMQFDRLSLPSDGTAGVDLMAAIEPSIRDVVDKFEDFMLQDADVWTSISRDSSHLKPYSDPSLKSRPKYLSFIKMLHDRGMLSFTDRCRGRVGAFTVSKKPKVVDGVTKHRQRLVLDCRQTNQLFRPAPHTELGSLASLTEIKLPAGEKLFISGADIQDCFYAVHIPAEMMQFFCLEFDVTPEEACWVSGSDSWIGRYHSGSRVLSPCINVLPMGFSWSFFLVQHIHQSSVCRSLNISEDSLFLDGRPCPTLVPGSIYSMPYCDNIHSICLGSDLCEEGKNKIVDDLSSLGFTIHEEEPCSTRFETLGGEIDGEAGQVRMTSRRAWDLIRAFEHVAHHSVSPSTMQQLLGHAMFFSTLNRAGMSVFRRCYDFVEKGGVERRLNDREREECLTFAGLIPLLYADIRRGWCQTVQCTDASPDGFGICETTLSSTEVESMGRWCQKTILCQPRSARVLKTELEARKPVASRRTITRIPVHQEKNLGKRAQSQQLTVLEERSVSIEVQNQYATYYRRFENFCRANGLGFPVVEDVDAILADFLDLMFLDGRFPAEGENVVASVEFNNIRLKGKLVRCKRALKGWRKEKPPQSRLPLPRLVAAGMAMVMVSQGQRLMGLKLMLDHDTYLRPGESIELKAKDVVAPVKNSGKHYKWHSIIVRDIEDLRPDKAGVYDNSIPLDSLDRQFLGPLIWSHTQNLKSKESNLFPFTAAQYRKVFQQCGETLNLKNLHPYQTRHGGASEDLNSGARDFQQVKIRGRWHTDQSVRRYAKVGKIQKLMANLSRHHMEFCQWSLKNMEKVLSGRMAPRVP